MTTYHRRQCIIDMFGKQPDLRVSELVKALDISKGKVRNDLNALAEKRCLQHIRGCAVRNESDRFRNDSSMRRYCKNVAAKLVIARSAACLIQDNDPIFLNESSTCY